MSIDSRLRDGLRAEASHLETHPDWADVLARTSRADARSRSYRVAGAAVAAFVMAVVVITVRTADRDIAPAPPPSPSPSPSVPVPKPLPVEGSWTTGELPVSRVAAQLESVGLGRWSARVYDGDLVPETYAVGLRISGGEVSAVEWWDGTSRGQVDHQTYEVSGRSITFTVEDGSCASVLRWRVVEDRLTLRIVSDDCPDYLGVPDEAYIQKLYAAAPFRRVTE